LHKYRHHDLQSVPNYSQFITPGEKTTKIKENKKFAKFAKFKENVREKERREEPRRCCFFVDRPDFVCYTGE
jgi:hypothetical protein